MTPQRPTEVVNASMAISQAWDKYDAFVEAGDKVGAKAAWAALEILEDMYNSQYQQWQILGGTSDIESIALAGVVENTTPRHDADWEQHCNETLSTRNSDYPR